QAAHRFDDVAQAAGRDPEGTGRRPARGLSRRPFTFRARRFISRGEIKPRVVTHCGDESKFVSFHFTQAAGGVLRSQAVISKSLLANPRTPSQSVCSLSA